MVFDRFLNVPVADVSNYCRGSILIAESKTGFFVSVHTGMNSSQLKVERHKYTCIIHIFYFYIFCILSIFSVDFIVATIQ